MAGKGPQYLNCNAEQTSCTRKKAQPRLGCPTCEFTIHYKMFRKELDEELEVVPRGTRQGAIRWPVEQLLKHVVEVATIANSIEGNEKSWPVQVALKVNE